MKSGRPQRSVNGILLLRVIAGKYRRRRLKTPAGRNTRPMPDRLREALFNALGDEISGKVFVDLYAGSGAVGIEALSRGASEAVFVEKDRAALAAIEQNLKGLGAEKDALVIHSNVSAALAGVSGDIFFLGPPYARLEEYAKTLEALGSSTEQPTQGRGEAAPSDVLVRLLAQPTLVLAQHPSRNTLGEHYGRLHLVRTLTQGSNSVSFYRFSEAETAS